MASKSTRKPLQWPICIIDFEATSLSKQSYPIEVGVCLWTDPSLPARTWGALIRPHETWLAEGDWSEEAFALHGISQQELKDGLTPYQVAETLLTFCAPADLIFCDGGDHDRHWHSRISTAAERGTGILLASLQKMLFHHGIFDEYEDLSSKITDRHRALPDAIDIMQRIAKVEGLDLEIDLPDASVGPTQIALAKEALRL